MKLVRLILAISVCFTISMIAGCGGGSDNKPIANLVPCSGTVTLDGKPLERGSVGFEPENKTGQAAVGQINKEGKFTIVTTVTARGVVAGKYKVRIESNQQSKPKTPGDFTPPVSMIPVKYNAIKTSGLEVEVKPGMASVKFELTSK